MILKDALKKAIENEKIKSYCEDNGYCLTAAMSMPLPGTYDTKSWILIYYNKEKNRTIQVTVTDKLEIKDPEEPLKPSKEELKIESIKVNSNKALKKARNKFTEFGKPLSQVIINLMQNEIPFWRFSFITKSIEVITIEINSETGEITRSEIQSLVKVEK